MRQQCRIFSFVEQLKMYILQKLYTRILLTNSFLYIIVNKMFFVVPLHRRFAVRIVFADFRYPEALDQIHCLPSYINLRECVTTTARSVMTISIAHRPYPIWRFLIIPSE